VGLGFDDRQQIRMALDAQRRQVLARARGAGYAAGVPRCTAVAMSGRACRNLAGGDGLCNVHNGSRQKAA
jgi:hypothetical protein